MPDSSLRPHARPETLDTSGTPASAGGPVTREATRHLDFDPLAPLLLGIFGAEGARGALIRLPNGRVTRVQQGDRVAGAPVLAISESSVFVAFDGAARKIALPGA
ncbi:MAG: amidophosphoribosyltransferase [Pseudooceanicola sp.]